MKHLLHRLATTLLTVAITTSLMASSAGAMTPSDYYNAVLNHKVTPIYTGNTTTPQPTPTPQPVPVPVPTPQPADSSLSTNEARLVEMINSARSSAGAPQVTVDPKLVQLAHLRAQDMIAKNYFGHFSPTYGTFGQMLSKNRIYFSSCGENLCKAGDIYRAHMLLLYSTDGHREIMLNPSYSKIGVAVIQMGNYVLVVEDFMQP